MSGSPIWRISVWDYFGEAVGEDKVHVKFELEDGRDRTRAIPRDTMSDLACWLHCHFDPQTESFRPFLGGTAGWVWEKWPPEKGTCGFETPCITVLPERAA